jgi:hypothetical protein
MKQDFLKLEKSNLVHHSSSSRSHQQVGLSVVVPSFSLDIDCFLFQESEFIHLFEKYVLLQSTIATNPFLSVVQNFS